MLFLILLSLVVRLPLYSQQKFSRPDELEHLFLWQTKAMGTHNSYAQLDPFGVNHYKCTDRVTGETHQSCDIKRQLDNGFRIFEFDIATIFGGVWHGPNPFILRHCVSATDCLTKIFSWRQHNHNHKHYPIIVMFEFAIGESNYRKAFQKIIEAKNYVQHKFNLKDDIWLVPEDHNKSIKSLRG